MDRAEAQARPEPVSTIRILGMDSEGSSNAGNNQAQRETLDSMLKRDPLIARRLSDLAGSPVPTAPAVADGVNFRKELDGISNGSKLEGYEKFKVIAGVSALDLAVGFPAAFSNSNWVFRGTYLGVGTLNYFHSRNAVDKIETERESAKIKDRFKTELGPGGINKIEEQCTPSKKDKAQAYINGMAEQGAVGFIAGKTIAPMTAGWSLPVMTLAGIGNGALHARTNLALQQSQCEVKAMREKLLKW